MGQLTDASVVLRLGYQAIRRAGLPTEEILTKAGVALNQVEANDRTPLGAQYAFWVAAEEVSRDPDIGLHLGEYLPLYRGQVIEHLFISSENFGEGLKRALAYQRLISDAFDAKLVIEDDRCYLTNGQQPWADNIVNRHFSECAMSGILRFFKFITEGKFQPLYIDFNFQQGAADDEYFRVYECPVSLGQNETRLYFDPSILEYPLWQAEPELLQLHEQLALEKLQELARYDLVGEVRRAIGSTLESGETTLETVAAQLNITPRRLRTQLSEANTSFQQILSDYRCRLAKKLLANTNESVERIVYLTGFSEPSTFYRAFKRWTNETPVEYRKRKQR
ncbi:MULTISPECIES: AraC family transcriptional regulator [Acinetobacter]|uniref:AraC family transcriptional regulator n=1 Tax=Acinetobacter indicus TaxID=756892 RepID=A0A6C0Y5R3_9GAMM|nr:AraC family transcriptional regulator [Acinetobacter indicus]MDM1771398.1 AraC family transcriptional regulator [Acinetobacter indicus]MDM1774180.1 AraC family transcriptional regulator [Acinetobacter indicus]QFS16441.1 AraC family transcriptional regulator [Acinetobacter indicus]QIC71212.1 AraC family transcriptional regulator [Acinetobacter indicus]QOW53885.1 AraC family transcriptional regulator [Acinetobacter indicus]